MPPPSLLHRWAAAALKRNLAVCGEEEGEVLSSVFTRAAQLLADLLPTQAVDFAQGEHQPNHIWILRRVQLAGTYFARSGC